MCAFNLIFSRNNTTSSKQKRKKNVLPVASVVRFQMFFNILSWLAAVAFSLQSFAFSSLLLLLLSVGRNASTTLIRVHIIGKISLRWLILILRRNAMKRKLLSFSVELSCYSIKSNARTQDKYFFFHFNMENDREKEEEGEL